MRDEATIRTIIRQILADHPQVAVDYWAGQHREALLKVLVDSVLRATRGAADPEVAARIALDEVATHRDGGTAGAIDGGPVPAP